MRNTFKPTQNNQKQHNRNVIDVLAYALAHADRGTLFTNSGKLQELVVGGEQNGVVINDTPGKFSLSHQSTASGPGSGVSWKSRTRIVLVESPGEGAYAFKIKTGRDMEITVFCNKLCTKTYHCEATWKQGTEYLGSIEYRIAPGLMTLE